MSGYLRSFICLPRWPDSTVCGACWGRSSRAAQCLHSSRRRWDSLWVALHALSHVAPLLVKGCDLLFALMQGCTVLAMDLMENGSLWMGLTRTGKDGKPLFQWNQRSASASSLGAHILSSRRSHAHNGLVEKLHSAMLEPSTLHEIVIYHC